MDSELVVKHITVIPWRKSENGLPDSASKKEHQTQLLLLFVYVKKARSMSGHQINKTWQMTMNQEVLQETFLLRKGKWWPCPGFILSILTCNRSTWMHPKLYTNTSLHNNIPLLTLTLIFNFIFIQSFQFRILYFFIPRWRWFCPLFINMIKLKLQHPCICMFLALWGA